MAPDIQDLLERSLRDVYAPSNLADRVVARGRRRRRSRRVAAALGAAVFAAAAAALTWVALDTTPEASSVRVVPAGQAPSPVPKPQPSPVPIVSLIPAAERRLAPALEGMTVDGKALKVDLRRGETAAAGAITVINFCGAWSAPCREEQKALTLKGVELGGAAIIGVDERDSLTNIRAYVQQFHVTYPIIVDTGALERSWNPGVGVPLTVVVDAKGRIAARFIGQIGRDDLLGAIKLLTVEQQSSVAKVPPPIKPTAGASQTADPKAVARKIAAASTAAAKPEMSKGTVPSLPQASPAQTPATSTAPPVKP